MSGGMGWVGAWDWGYGEGAWMRAWVGVGLGWGQEAIISRYQK